MMTHRTHRPFLSAIIAIAALALLSPIPSTVAQDVPPAHPMEITCAHGASIQLLKATPIEDGSQTLILGRLILEPGGEIGPHRNVGWTNVVVESGAFGFTLLEDEVMVVVRSATEHTEATTVPVTPGEQVTLRPGDGYTPPVGAAHIGTNLSDGETTALFSALVETGEHLEQCVDLETATPSGHVGITA